MSQWGEAREFEGVTFVPLLAGAAFKPLSDGDPIAGFVAIDAKGGVRIGDAMCRVLDRFKGSRYADWLAIEHAHR